MIRLHFNDKYLKIADRTETTKSSREVTFNELTVDFENHSKTSLPIKYQEVQVSDYEYVNGQYIEKERIFTGYVDDFKLSDMKLEDQNKTLQISLLSPMALASLKSVSAIGNFKLRDLILKLVQPLLDDGFNLVELNVKDSEVQVNYLLETIEYCLNKQSNKNNFWWYIDENKNIYINDIDYQFSKEPTLIYDDNNDIEGLYNVIPSMEATDYCNVVNFKNVRIYNFSYYFQHYYIAGDPTNYNFTKDVLLDTEMVINEGDTLTFKYPIDISVDNIKKSIESNDIAPNNKIVKQLCDEVKKYVLYIDFKYDEEGHRIGSALRIDWDSENEKIVIPSHIGFQGEGTSEEKYVYELIRDPFFTNLITGVKINTISPSSIDGKKQYRGINKATSCSALIYTRLRFMDDLEIQKCKGKINKSGQVEKIVDMGEQWKTYEEMRDIANSYISRNGSQADTITLEIDNYKDENINANVNVGDIIEVHKSSFLVDDKFIVTDIKETNSQTDKQFKKWSIQARNYNYLENFIDMFREKETQENEEKNNILVTSNYQEEVINEVHEVLNI